MNYELMIKDFNNGTIDAEKWQLVMDNDGGYWSCIDYSIDDDKRQEMEKEMKDKYGSPNGYRDIVDALSGAGVNCDWC